MGKLAAAWGLGGFLLLLGNAIVRLGEISLSLFDSVLTMPQIMLLVVVVIFMAYAEGYKGFQLRFSPRFAARVKYLLTHATVTRLILAPLFCMGFFDASRKRILSSVILTVFIIMLIILLRRLDQPWRAILDAGVVVGLSWGAVVTLVYTMYALLFDDFKADPEVVVSKHN